MKTLDTEDPSQESTTTEPKPNGGVTGIDALLAPVDTPFSITIRPLLLKGLVGSSVKTGCVVLFRSPESTDSDVCQAVEDAWKALMKRPNTTLLQSLRYLLLKQTDDSTDILESGRQLSRAQNPLAGEDEADWLLTPCSFVLRSYALLRRLAMPLLRCNSSGELKPMAKSFLDLLLSVKSLRSLVGGLILRRLEELGTDIANCTKPESALLGTLKSLLEEPLGHAGIDAASRKGSKRKKIVADGHDSCFVPESKRVDRQVVRDERKRLLDELEKRRKHGSHEASHHTVGGEVTLPYRIRNGCLLVTEEELSHDEFCSQTEIMAQVNKTLPRTFTKSVSRPKLHKVDISKSGLSSLRSVFFDRDGSLRNAIVGDLDTTTRHGYIDFFNSSCLQQRNDYRWQVPIKRHSIVRFVDTRSQIESLLSANNVISPNHERIHDMGMLIGGTEDQSLHHDIPRQTTSWLPRDPEVAEDIGVPMNGWEFDRAAYNEAMASTYAPCSILLGMSETGDVKLGVQKNQIERYGCADGWCKILDGKEDEEFRIVRETEYLVVLEARPGGAFTGDFQHAGVRNFEVGSDLDRLMMDFYGRVEAILEEGEEHETEQADMTKDIITMMCNFPNLNRICRFHCSTEPLTGALRIPRNTVGFVDCQPNPPEVALDVASRVPEVQGPDMEGE